MAQGFADRALTIAITATLTSAVWIVAGSVYLDDPAERGAAVESQKNPRVADVPQPGPWAQAAPAAGVAGATGEAGLIIPVAGVAPAQLQDTFADAREDGERRHEALDIAAPAGTPVFAAATGTIERLFRSDAGGNTVYVRSPDRRTIYYYAHLQDYAPGLAEGQAIARGERLGSVGSSGNASPSAPHLHFAILRTIAEAEWWEPATAINPYPLLRGT